MAYYPSIYHFNASAYQQFVPINIGSLSRSATEAGVNNTTAVAPSNTTAAWTSAGSSVDCNKGGPAAAAGYYVGGVAGGAAWTLGLSPLSDSCLQRPRATG